MGLSAGSAALLVSACNKKAQLGHTKKSTAQIAHCLMPNAVTAALRGFHMEKRRVKRGSHLRREEVSVSSHSVVAIFKKSRLFVLLCFAQRWRVHAAHWVATGFVDVCFTRSQVVSIATPHVLLCLHVSFSVLEASASSWHQAHRGRVAFSRCHAMNVRCSDTPLVDKPNVVERTGASPKVL